MWGIQLFNLSVAPRIYEIIGGPFFHRIHEGIRYAYGYIKIIQLMVILFTEDKFQDIGMIHPHYGHVGPPSGTSLLDLFCSRIEYPH